MNRADRVGFQMAAALAAWAFLAVAAARPVAACTTDPECDDGSSCNGVETCSAGSCQPGTPKPNHSACSDGNACTVSDQCLSGVCVGKLLADGLACNDQNNCTTGEVCLGGSCQGTAVPDTTPCEDGNTCTVGDECTGGICVSGDVRDDGEICVDGDPCTGPDTCLAGECMPGPRDAFDLDGDGDCDVEEDACGCNKTDPQEVCVLPNRLGGGGGSGSAEVLIEWHTPTARKVHADTDESCATTGKCEVDVDGAKRCTKGKIRDACALDSDCNQPLNTCRFVVNWAATPDLELLQARLSRTNLPGFTPVTGGCSRKVDVVLDATRKTNRIRVRVRGTANGRLRRDRDRFRYYPVPTP